MAWPVERVIRLGFVVALAVLLGLGWLSYRAASDLVNADYWVSHTHDVLTDLADVEASITRAESAQRGFILSNDPVFLQHYREGVAATRKVLDVIAAQTTDNAAQQRNAAILRPLVQARLDLLESHLNQAEQQGMPAVRHIVGAGGGEVAQAKIRNQVAIMQVEEHRLLAERSRLSRRSANATFVLFTLAACLQLALVVSVYLLMRRDIELRRQSETQLRASADELRATGTALARSNRELQDFASVASHDLQEPLRKIQAFGDRLKVKVSDTMPPEALDYLQRMQAAAGRMQTLINDLLAFSRVTSRAQPYISVNLTQVVREVLIDLEFRLEQIYGEVEVGDLPTIDADPMQMRQLFQNLIGNALKFHKSDEKPLVKISASWPEHGSATCGNGDAADDHPGPRFCQLMVSDNGIGFDLKYLDRIFTVFQRLHGRTEFEGTGVGLAVCRRIAERHGGSITARSAPGEGATFIVTLPMRQRPAAPAEPVRPHAEVEPSMQG